VGAESLQADRMSTAAGLFNAVDMILPDAEKILQAAQIWTIERKKASYEQSLSPEKKEWRSYGDLLDQGSVDALVAAAGKATPEARDQLYARAAAKALMDNDAESARQSAGNISNPQQRESRMTDIDEQGFTRSVQQGKLEDAGQYIQPGAPVEDRISKLLFLASLAIQKGQDATARRYLDESLTLLPARAQNQFHFSIQLQIARCYSSVDLNRSFEILVSSIETLNELLDAAVVLDGFGGDFFKDGELKPYNGGIWEELLRECAEGLAALAPRDSERAFNDAAKLRRPEAQTLATLRIAQSFLLEKSKNNASHARN